MIDFSSSLYLGMQHKSGSWKNGQALTTGKPAVLFEPAANKYVAKNVATMQGLENGLLCPSTLHSFWDLYDWINRLPAVIFMDKYIYPVSKYGMEKSKMHHIPVYFFKHMDIAHLEELIAAYLPSKCLPIIFSDGWVPTSGKAAPINQYVKLAIKHNGYLVLDDTQAFGILGEKKNATNPFGCNGGGILKWLNVSSRRIISIVSLAKAFGVPATVISGSNDFVKDYLASANTRVHSSPTSNAHVQAAMDAIKTNASIGNYLRQMLWQNTNLFKQLLAKNNIKTNGGIFPIQSIECSSVKETLALYERLKLQEKQAVLTLKPSSSIPEISFVFSVDHSIPQIKQLAKAIIYNYPFTEKLAYHDYYS